MKCKKRHTDDKYEAENASATKHERHTLIMYSRNVLLGLLYFVLKRDSVKAAALPLTSRTACFPGDLNIAVIHTAVTESCSQPYKVKDVVVNATFRNNT